MALIFGSLEDLSNINDIPNSLLNCIKILIIRNKSLYYPIIQYWSEKPGNGDNFTISPLVNDFMLS
jgi:hypothetical protein